MKSLPTLKESATLKNVYKRNEHRAKVHGITQKMMKNQAMVPKAELSEPDEE